MEKDYNSIKANSSPPCQKRGRSLLGKKIKNNNGEVKTMENKTKYWKPKEGTPFILAQALSTNTETYNKEARNWLKTKTGNAFFKRLTKSFEVKK